jgi:hypothetical protein
MGDHTAVQHSHSYSVHYKCILQVNAPCKSDEPGIVLSFNLFNFCLQLEMDPEVSVTPLTAQEEQSSDQMNLTVYF